MARVPKTAYETILRACETLKYLYFIIYLINKKKSYGYDFLFGMTDVFQKIKL